MSRVLATPGILALATFLGVAGCTRRSAGIHAGADSRTATASMPAQEPRPGFPPPISQQQALKDVGYEGGNDENVSAHLERNGWHILSPYPCVQAPCGALHHHLIVDATSGKLLYDDEPFPGQPRFTDASPGPDPLTAGLHINEEQALTLAEQADCWGNYSGVTLERDGYHVSVSSKSMRPPCSCVVDGRTGQVRDIDRNAGLRRAAR